MRRCLKSFLFLFLFSNCSRISYVFHQGKGQFKLLFNARPNEEVLADPAILKSHKEKIKSIETYKKYFSHYFGVEISSIYSKTTFLDQEAVSYLVVASPFHEIKPKEECFPFVGCFPYLGFFDQEKAKKHAHFLKKKGFEVFIRPVYAYSTLGYFTDNILSSFFHYNKNDLAELIFHELFHTLFFIKGNVALNENLANYFGREMSFEYFQFDKIEREKRMEKNLKKQRMAREITYLAKKLNKVYKEKSPQTQKEAANIREGFLKATFYPHLKPFCKELSWPCQAKWNNASLAEFLTYEEKSQNIARLREELNLTLRAFFSHITKKHKEYRKTKREVPFEEFLWARK